jgi:parvulin-like peptidyl-prolyl isomerase
MAYSPFFRVLADKARHFRALPVLLVGIALLTACHKPAVTDPNDPNFVVASKGDWTITRGQLTAEVDNFLKQKHATREMVGAANMPYVDTGVLRRMVLKKLLLEKAATMQLTDVDKDTQAQIAQAKEGVPPGHTFDDELKSAGLTMDQLTQQVHDAVVVQKVIEAEAFKDVQPTEQEIDDIYNTHKDAFQVPPMIQVSRVLILVGDKDTAAYKAAKKKQINDARARVMKGEDFSKVATEVSQDRYSAPKGGDMGKFPKGHNEAGFDEVAFNTKVGTVSPVFLDALGYQFVKVTKSEPAGTVSLADARAYIAPKLLELKKDQKANDYAKSVLANSGVTFNFTMVDPPAQMGGPGGPGGQGAPGGASPDQGAPPSGSAQGEPAPAGEPAPPPAPSGSAEDSSAPSGNLSAPDLSAATNSAPPAHL